MGMLNLTVSTVIAIFYNLFVHHLTSMLFKNDAYQDKINKSITFLLISGIIGVVMSKTIFEKNDPKSDKAKETYVVSNGLWLGGILLIITSIFVNWQDLSDEIKLIMVFVTLVSLIYYSKKTLEFEQYIIDDRDISNNFNLDDVQDLDDLDKL
jgi:uncharacterized membrane protein